MMRTGVILIVASLACLVIIHTMEIRKGGQPWMDIALALDLVVGIALVACAWKRRREQAQ